MGFDTRGIGQGFLNETKGIRNGQVGTDHPDKTLTGVAGAADAPTIQKAVVNAGFETTPMA